MQSILPLKLRALDPEADWYFFQISQPVTPEDRTLIQPLEEESAKLLWQELVSAKLPERHPMLLPPGHWTGNIVACGPDWQQQWSASLPDAVAEFLQSKICWPDHAEVYLILMREWAVQLSWGVFLRTWRAFLYSDEGPFLVRVQSPEFVVFPPQGPVGVGHRFEPISGLKKS